MFLLIGPRRGEGRFCALWSLAREEFPGLCVLVGSKSSFVYFLCKFRVFVSCLCCCIELLFWEPRLEPGIGLGGPWRRARKLGGFYIF